MSKKKKHKFFASEPVAVTVGGELEGLNLIRVEEENNMGNEWFYLNDISWFKAVDGRIVTPVKCVVTHLSEQPKGFRFMSKKAAEQCIVDVAPFGKCYERQALESLWDELNGHGVTDKNQAESEESSEDQKTESEENSEDQNDCTDDENEPSEEGQFVNCQKFSENSETCSEDDAKNA